LKKKKKKKKKGPPKGVEKTRERGINAGWDTKNLGGSGTNQSRKNLRKGRV